MQARMRMAVETFPPEKRVIAENGEDEGASRGIPWEQFLVA